MVVGEASINNIMGGIESTGGVRLHNHKRKLKQRFDIIKKLGQGTYGKVQLGINKETGQEVAIKTIKKSKIETEADLIRIRREIQIMSSVQHPNIIHIYEVFENREKMVLVMEYAAGGELYDYLSERKVLAEEEARRIFRQIATASYYCHKHKICHRDLKLENILLDENGNAKIADFGLSNVFDETRLLSTFCGSPLYASPEIVKGTPYHGPEVDCWSLGVLLYTLVYGAMPFDGSNFKRLVKTISQGDYYEPKKPSSASPLIRDMLTVNPRNRADIEKICTHWWVNEGYSESCLDISEYLANQTPVRLDLLLSLAPPPPQLESDKLVVTGEIPEESIKLDATPVRSQSVGSLMELSHPAERRIKDLLVDLKTSPKRKLENTVSSDHANISTRKDKIIKENTIADISVHATIQENASQEDATSEPIPLDKSRTQTLSRDMDVEPTEELADPSLQGAACSEIIEESKKTKPIDVTKTPSTMLGDKILEEINETPSQENLCDNIDKENVGETLEKPKTTKPAKKGVLVDTNDNTSVNSNAIPQKDPKLQENETEICDKKTETEPEHKPIERRKSRIYEQAEKFQNMIAASESKSGVSDKPKKVILPGVNVDTYKKEFERKASLTSTSPPKLKGSIPKRISIDKQPSTDQDPEKPEVDVNDENAENKKEVIKSGLKNAIGNIKDDERKKQLKTAVSIITNALDKEGARKSKSRPCIRKPPVPFGASGRSASGSIGMITSPISPINEDFKFLKLQIDSKAAADQEIKTLPEAESKTSSAEITLKSATLPRRKTTKAEIQLNYPQPKPATMEFKTEMAHRIEAPPKLATERTEAVFPVSAIPRSSSLEPETKTKQQPKERIIPISFEKKPDENETAAAPKPPTPKILQNQKSYQSQRSNSLSRQSTQESDSETVSGEPIRKSPREYIIPIAVEGGGYVTPRAGSLEPSDTASTTSTMTNNSRRTNKFGRTNARRMNSLLSDRDNSEDESPFMLHRHSSFGKDSDTEDSRKDAFHMHRLRSSRPRKANLEHTDSLSSGEEDDDDGFEILTAENLFSTLLSRVRDLTQRINVDDGSRPGFPNSRLLSHFDHGTNFWNLQNRMDPFSRTAPLGRVFTRDRVDNSPSSRQIGAPWRRSVSRDLATDIESVFNDSKAPPTQTASLPRGEKSKNDNLNLSDLDLKQLKLSEEDAIALSYLTPGLSRRIQKQLLAQLPPSEARKLTRTMSMRNPRETNSAQENKQDQKSTSVDNDITRRYSNEAKNTLTSKHDLPNEPNVKQAPRDRYTPYNNLSGHDFSHPKSRAVRSTSLREPRSNYSMSKFEKSPDSSVSDNVSCRTDYVDSTYSDSKSESSKTGSVYNTDSSTSRPSNYALYSPESPALNKYLTPNKYYDAARSYSPTYDDLKKTDLKRASVTTRRISRFLRPDFYEKPKEENVVVKEKKEREMETQKVLKEIRDKRKGRLSLHRGKSASREKSKIEDESDVKSICAEDTKSLLNNVSTNIKNIETNVVTSLDANGSGDVIVKKERLSKLIRPKSYPTENVKKAPSPIPEKDAKSKIGRLKKTSVIEVDAPKSTNGTQKSSKNKFFQSIEKKFEKLRSFNSPSKENVDDKKNKDDKNSIVESAIKQLREQSLPNKIDHCITESGLIKRAVSVEDLTLGATPKELQPSRKSVTKILGLFKKYEEKDKKTTSKLKKSKEPDVKPEIQCKFKDLTNPKDSDTKLENQSKPKTVKGADKPISNKPDVAQKPKLCANEAAHDLNVEATNRPKSLPYDEPQKIYNGTKTDPKDVTKSKLSKLPFRRSLNLDNSQLPDPPKFYKNPNKTDEQLNNNANSSNQSNNNNVGNINTKNINENTNKRADRRNLMLDFSKIPQTTVEPTPCSSTSENNSKENRNSVTTDDSSLFLSPYEDMSCDSWSVCSDHHTQDLLSPISPNGYVYSGDENESVIDRIRRKSFYTRFNEKKKPKKGSLAGNYRDLDLYKDYSQRKPSYRLPNEYGSLDRKYVDSRSDRRSSYSSIPDPVKKDYKSYTRSSTLLNDYVNVPHRFQTYNPRLSRNVSLCSPETDDAMDDNSPAGKSRKNSFRYQPSRINNTASVSPSIDNSYTDVAPAVNQNRITSPTI